MQRHIAGTAVNVTELKKNPATIVERSAGAPVAILSHNRVLGYMIQAQAFEEIMDRLEDFERHSRCDTAGAGDRRRS